MKVADYPERLMHMTDATPPPPSPGGTDDLPHLTPYGFLHGIICANVYDVLRPFVRVYRLGYVLGHGVLYDLGGDDTTASPLVPDVSFVRKGRLPAGFDLARPFPGAPDLAVEVISPNETASDVLARVDAYLNAGTVQAWVLFAQRRELYQYLRTGGKTTVSLYGGSDRVAVEALFPGLELVVERLFNLPNLGES
jgi:Uma2 family endonuclease